MPTDIGSLEQAQAVACKQVRIEESDDLGGRLNTVLVGESGRFVRVQLEEENCLQLAQVEVMSDTQAD